MSSTSFLETAVPRVGISTHAIREDVLSRTKKEKSSGRGESPLPDEPASSEEESVECNGCLADTPPEDVITVEHCRHLICRECIRRNTIDMTGNAALCPVILEDGTPCNSRVQDSAL